MINETYQTVDVPSTQKDIPNRFNIKVAKDPLSTIIVFKIQYGNDIINQGITTRIMRFI